MGDLKTTQERRDRFRTWLHDDTRDHLSIRAWCVAEDACDDVDTLLAENAKLRAVAEAARELALDMLPAGTWRRTGARGPACLPLPGAVPSLCAEWRSALGGRVWRPCDPRPGCEGCASLAEHRCEP